LQPYYDDGTCTIYHGDCRDVLPELSGVQLVITDPPYSSGARRDAERQVRGSMLRSMEDEDWFSHDAMTAWGFTWFMRSTFSDMRPRLVEGAHVYVFIDWRQTPSVYGMLESTGYRVNQCLVWAKTHFGMGAYWRNQHENIVFASNGMPMPMLDRGMGSVITSQGVPPEQRVHPTEKPLSLLLRLMQGRRAVGCEVDERFCEIAARRLAQESLPFTEAAS
jgi:site-specific DNA-methyltransferase (adenine-specific)